MPLATSQEHSSRNSIQSRTYISPLNPMSLQFYSHGTTSTRLPPMDTTGQPDDFIPPLAFPAKLPTSSPPDNSPPSMPVSRSGDIIAKSTNIPQNNNELINLGSLSANSGPTVQRRPPYERTEGDAVSDGRSDVAAGATLPHASRPDTCADIPRSADNQIPAISAAVSKNHSAIAVRSASSELDIKLDIQSPLGQVSHKLGVLHALEVLTSSSPPQPIPRADNTEVIPVHDISSSEPSNVAILNEIQVANHEGIFSLNRALSTSPVEPSSPTLPAITPPLSQNVHIRASQGAGDIPFGPPKAAEPAERGRSPSQVDSLGEETVMKPLAQQVDRTASVRPFPTPTHPGPPLKRRGISMSSSISRAASVLTMIAPSRKGTAREELPVDPHILSGRAPSELSHQRDEDKGNAYTNEQTPPSPRGRATSTAESPSLPLPVFGPHLWDEIYSSIRGSEGVSPEVNGPAVGPTFDQERRRVTALDEWESCAEDSNAISDGAQRRTAELNPSSNHTPDIVIPKRPPECPVGRTYSFNHSPRYDPNVPRLLETSGESRSKLDRTLNSAPFLDRTEILMTPAQPAVQRQTNHATRVPSNDDLTSPNAHTPSQPQTVVSDSQARAVLCPGPAVHSDGSPLGEKAETRPDISLSTEIPLMPITTQPTPQERPSLHPRSSPLGDGCTEPGRPGQAGGDRKPGDGRTEDEGVREAGPESPSQSNHGSQGCFKELYRRAWKIYPRCC